MELFDKLADAIVQNNIVEVEQIISDSFALDETDEDGAPVLYTAIMHGNLQIVRLLLERGANPNFVAEEPAATIYDEKPLNLVQGLRFLVNWDEYQPIAKLLVEFGATDSEGRTDISEDDLKVLEQGAKNSSGCCRITRNQSSNFSSEASTFGEVGDKKPAYNNAV